MGQTAAVAALPGGCLYGVLKQSGSVPSSVNICDRNPSNMQLLKIKLMYFVWR